MFMTPGLRVRGLGSFLYHPLQNTFYIIMVRPEMLYVGIYVYELEQHLKKKIFNTCHTPLC